MYSYTWDAETGGLLLNTTPLAFSKEPRPVYYKELDILGFDKHWNYAKDDAYPYMWAEANNYFYRGRLVAKTKGGSLYTAPELILLDEPEPAGSPLRFVDIDAMVQKNRELLEKLVQDTIKKIYNTYFEYRRKIDVFYVAFSGGKDSVVTLDLVQKALPHNEFKVLFGDTGMEFPDTYRTVDHIEERCVAEKIEFIRAKSDYPPDVTWRQFGPPATVTRWCCGVHKTVPQVLALRNVTSKPNFTGMAFIGIRASESVSRSEYDYVSLGEKHKGQYSCNPIIEWNSAELFCYIYQEALFMNEAYKKGHRRAGCLVCPRAAGRNDYMSRIWYTSEYDSLIDHIKAVYRDNFPTEEKLDQFIASGGWKARKNGRDLSLEVNYKEDTDGNNTVITVTKPRTDWKEWIKTIGVLQGSSPKYTIFFQKELFAIEVREEQNVLEAIFHSSYAKQNPLFVKLLKNVFRKAGCCVQCRECEADCHNGCIHMNSNMFYIDDHCVHCAQCHKVEKGCLVYKSLEPPQGGLKMAATQSLNCYSHHAPKRDWFNQYFALKNDFHQKHTLGSQMYGFFKRFLKDAGLSDDKGFSCFAQIIDRIGLDDEQSWALMLVNLAYTPQIGWFLKRIPMFEPHTRDYTLSLLVADGAKESWVGDIWGSFGRFMDLPFASVGMGTSVKEKNRFVSFTRTPWKTPAPLVILYSLYKFAEACGGYYQFTLTRLLDIDVESDGVSPAQIFGLDRSTMEKLLTGLGINYPEFITAQFTLDLDTIMLNADHTSADVLALF